MLLLVNTFMGSSVIKGENWVSDKIIDFIHSLGLNLQFPDIIPLLLLLLSTNLIMRCSLLTFDGALFAILRRRIQETIF